MAKPTKLSHYVLKSHQPHRLADWYAALLDGDVVFRSGVLTLVTYDEEHHRIGFGGLPSGSTELDDQHENGRPGLSHVAFGYDSVEALLDCFEKARNRGDRPVVSIHHGLTISLYYKDPDGNNVETFIDCFPTSEASMAYMRSPAFQKNPVGIPFDADKALANIKAGMNPKEATAFDTELEIDVMKLGHEIVVALG